MTIEQQIEKVLSFSQFNSGTKIIAIAMLLEEKEMKIPDLAEIVGYSKRDYDPSATIRSQVKGLGELGLVEVRIKNWRDHFYSFTEEFYKLLEEE